MRSLALFYNLRHLLARRASAVLTISGIALVVFVYVVSLMLAQGLRQTLGATGSESNVILIRNGAQNEIQSGINKEHANIILTDPAVEKLPNGLPRAITDSVVLVSLKRRRDGQPSNVNVRGTSRNAFDVREGIYLSAGRLPAPGTKEVIVGKAIHEKFQEMDIGSSVRLVGIDWNIVGIFDAGNSAFSSEIWGDVDVLMPAFRRERYSSVTFRRSGDADFSALKARLEDDRRLTVTVKIEKTFYEDLSRSLSTFITVLGTFVSVIFAIGAVIGATITMYSAVANRTREIGILRAIGFKRSAIFFAFLKESLLIALTGGAIGMVLASFAGFVGISTTNFTTFSEIAFNFMLTRRIVLNGLLFALGMGLIGGALPALRAGRLGIIDSLRSE